MDLTSGSGPGDAQLAACEALAAALQTVGQPLAMIDALISAKLGMGRERFEAAAVVADEGPVLSESIVESHQRLIDAVIGHPGTVSD